MCTLEKRGDLFILTITGHDDHRLNPTLIDSIRSSLHQVRSQSTSSTSTALITTAQGNFFSNGFDLSWAFSVPDPSRPLLMTRKLRLLVADLISFPMPTIAAVTGHASAAGFILALCHDYILMRKDRGYLYMSELDIKLKISSWFAAVLRSKIGEPKVWREVVLTAAKITAERGVELGIVDAACETAEKTVEAAVEMGKEMVKRKWDGRVYKDNRRTVFTDVLVAIERDETVGDDGEDGEVKAAVSKL